MPRSRSTEMPQRQSSLRAPPNIRTSSSSDSDPLHHRPRTERSPRLSNGRSPRTTMQSEPLNQKKLGTRISDLESQLGQAQDELKSLKHKIAAQEVLDDKSENVPENIPRVSNNEDEGTDVFEVSVEKLVVESKFTESPLVEINLVKSKLDEREKELEIFQKENEYLKGQLDDKSMKLSSCELEIEEMSLKLRKADDEVAKSRANGARLSEKLEATEKEKEELENEMKRLKVQTEQWRKAAESAASVLAGELEINGRGISERCGSMDNKYYGRAFEYEPEDVFGGEKRRVSGIRMFGDLWRKKGHK
ncbi:hypothetical protein ABFS83_08G199200 [Erythranthe nasuta]